jgi:integrase
VGWVLTRTDSDGNIRFTGIYRDRRGRKRSAGTFTSERRAERAWQRAERDQEAGRIGDPNRGKQLLRTYVEQEWFPNHVIEATTRENYRYALNRYILPELGDYRIGDVLPNDLREWIGRLAETPGVNPPTIVKCELIVDAIFTTALNDQVVFFHPGKGVKTPPVATRPRRIINAEQYGRIHDALGDDVMRLLVETDIESGLRWGELTELRVKDLDLATGMLTVCRAVVQLTAKNRPDGTRFVVKDYPKDKEWRRLRLAPHLVTKIAEHIEEHGLGADDLLFFMPDQSQARRYRIPEVLPDPETLGWTEPNEKDRRYRHGTATAYGMAKCRCRHCKNAVAAYRAARRAAGKDNPRTPKRVDTDGHIGRGWFRNNIWLKALAEADLGFHVTPHGLRHAHASWLLAGGADLQVVKERLGHASITTTEKYLHTLPDADDAALDALNNIRTVATPTIPPSREPASTTIQAPAPDRATEAPVVSPVAPVSAPAPAVDLASVVQGMGADTVRLLLTGLLQQTRNSDSNVSRD